jgi:hypothetical protein
MDLSALYPSATGGSGVTLSPLSTPATAPAAAPVAAPAAAHAEPKPAAHEPADSYAHFTELSDEVDPDDPSRYLPKHADNPAPDDGDGAVSDAAEPAAEVPILEARPKIEAAFRDVREVEPPATSVTDFATFARPVEGVEPIPEGLRAMVKLGLGITQAHAIWDASVDAVRNPVTTNAEGAAQALQAEYGEKYEAKLAAAKDVITQVEKTFPGVRQWLASTGLGNDPAFIRQVIDFAARRGIR